VKSSYLVLLFPFLAVLITTACGPKTNPTASMPAIRTSTVSGDTNQWGPITCGAQMSVRLDRDSNEIVANETFGMVVKIRNLSTKNQAVYDGGSRNDSGGSFAITIKSPSGKDISPPKDRTRAYYGGMEVNIPPMETVEMRFDLGALRKFDKRGTYLDEVGTYTIILKKKLDSSLSPDCCEEIVSNPISVRVVAAPTKAVTSSTNTVPKCVTP
jgi:hypothetical protein